jgi:hypothetical protein
MVSNVEASIAATEAALGRIVMKWGELEAYIHSSAIKYGTDPDEKNTPSHDFIARLNAWRRAHRDMIQDPNHLRCR